MRCCAASLAMRHQMVVHLQPIGMVTELMERRLGASARPGTGAREHGQDQRLLPRRGVMPGRRHLAGARTRRRSRWTRAGECLGLLRSAFNFRGFTLKVKWALRTEPVGGGLRNVLPACLLALTDRGPRRPMSWSRCSPRSGQSVLERVGAARRRRRRFRRRCALPAARVAGSGGPRPGRRDLAQRRATARPPLPAA